MTGSLVEMYIGESCERLHRRLETESDGVRLSR